MGSWAALAASSYDLPHVAVFSSELLREFFATRGYGVFAPGRDDGGRDSVSFENALTPVAAPSLEAMAGRERRRLLFYARPEMHGARNMFELGLLAISQGAATGGLDPGWDLEGIGAVEGRDRIHLGGGRSLEVTPRRDQAAYAELLSSYDVGLALMATPHPSLVPLEMASAGMLTVTNTFETKTKEALEAISPNLIAVAPSLEGLSAGIEEAVRRTADCPARAEGANVRWSRSWDESFDPGLMRRVMELLEGC
jgi:hypothetical protein